VAKAAETDFDIVAVDHYMPGMDGLATLEALRALPQAPPVVYVTGSEESRVAVAALKAGAVDYVVKTVGDDFFDLLDRALQQALEQMRLRAENKRAEAALAASNARLEALLGEVNHRVANSLQMVSAFIHLQAQGLTDDAAKAALRDTQQRIEAIMQVHRELYTSSEVEAVDMADYLRALVRELERTWSTPASPMTLKAESEAIRLATDRAVSLGVIINELISNACKYAYPDAGGEVRVALRAINNGVELRVEDDGVGMPASGRPAGTGLGGRLIRSMSESLGAELSYEPAAKGVAVRLWAPV
jgi:two-component sensor histidine kinase